jgi:hypothetical protein
LGISNLLQTEFATMISVEIHGATSSKNDHDENVEAENVAQV